MKISGDMAVKLAIVAAFGLVAFVIVRRATGAVGAAWDAVAAIPGRAVEAAREGGKAWQDGYKRQEIPPNAEGPAYGGAYGSPMVNDDGMDFSQLGG